jgi:multisubunit Na+/H+ antiporter MnhB subunit
MITLFDVGLIILITALAVSVVASRGAFSAVICFVGYGLLLSLAWARLRAVDIALTEAAIGGGPTALLLLGAVTGLDRGKARNNGPALQWRIAAGILCALISATLAAAVLTLPDDSPTLAPLAMEKLPQTGLGNPVAGVLFVYRALDTMLEKIVVLLALLGVWSLASDGTWRGIPGLTTYAGDSGALALLARVLAPLGIVAGVYMCWVGASAPGGAFQGGTILAAVWLLVAIAGLRNIPMVSNRWLRLALIVGPAVFLGIGLAGFALAGAFLAYPPDHAKTLIIIVEFALMLSIAAAIAMLAAGTPRGVRS